MLTKRNRPTAGAFTMVEMLTAVALLSLLVVLMAKALDIVTRLVSDVEKKSTAETEAKRFFAQIGTDLRQAMLRRDLDFSLFKHDGFTVPAELGGAGFGTNPQHGDDRVAFYAMIPGLTNSIADEKRSSASLVGYSVEVTSGIPMLKRSSQALAWEPESGATSLSYLPSTLTSAFPTLFSNADAAAENVFRFEVSYLLRSRAKTESPFAVTPWSNSLPPEERWPNGLSDVYAIVVTIAILDGRGREMTSNLVSVAALLPDAKDMEDPAPIWRDIVAAPDFAERSSLPPAAVGAIRIFQHTFPIAKP